MGTNRGFSLLTVSKRWVKWQDEDGMVVYLVLQGDPALDAAIAAEYALLWRLHSTPLERHGNAFLALYCQWYAIRSQ